jgi:hypothetical protein
MITNPFITILIIGHNLSANGRKTMLGWIVRMFLVVAGSITSWFVARDALNFNIIQMIIFVVIIRTKYKS